MRLSGLGPFDEIELGFSNDQGEPRLLTVIQGGGGVGKSTVLAALAATRPGNATVLNASIMAERETPGSAMCEFHLGQDDAERPHSLCVASPNARVYAEDDREMLRRPSREAGFVFVAIPATRWFSRQSLALVAPARNMARYDVRAASTGDDAARGELAREVKQVLAYAIVTSALASQRPKERRFAWLSNAVTHSVNALVKLTGYRFIGVDTTSLEPLFNDDRGRELQFE
jgi:hypothetical protein